MELRNKGILDNSINNILHLGRIYLLNDRLLNERIQDFLIDAVHRRNLSGKLILHTGNICGIYGLNILVFLVFPVTKINDRLRLSGTGLVVKTAIAGALFALIRENKFNIGDILAIYLGNNEFSDPLEIRHRISDVVVNILTAVTTEDKCPRGRKLVCLEHGGHVVNERRVVIDKR